MRLIFMGTPDFAVPTLLGVAAQHDVAAVYARAPKPAGRRGLELTPSPVEREARRLGLAVHTPASLKGDDALQTFKSHGVDATVVVAYGLLLPKPVLDAVPLGCFNLHASLLPRWRGAAPIHRAIMAGDAETGAMVMRMEEGLDTGPIAMADRLAIAPDTTTGALHDALARLGADLMARALAALERGSLQFTPQPATGATYAAKIDKAETRIDWSQSWREVHNRIRGLSPFPGAWCEIAGDRVRLIRSTKGEGGGPPGAVLDDRLTVACGDGAVRLVELQKAGGRPMPAEEFLRGSTLRTGEVLR